MSFDFRTIREPSGDPLLRFVKHLQRVVSKAQTKDLINQLEDSEDIFGSSQDTRSAIKFQTDLNYNHVFHFDRPYYPPIDGDFVTCWIKGTSMGSTMRDYSEYGNNGNIRLGEPILVNGEPFDYLILDGNIGVPSTAVRFNRTTSPSYNNESCFIPDNTNLQITGLSTGFSIFIRFRLQSIEETDGRSTTLYEKIDDSTPNNGFMLQVKNDGSLVAIVNKNGTITAKQTGIGVIEPNAVYDVWLTFDISGPTIKIYVNSGEQPLTDFTGSVNWQEDLTNHDLWLMNRGYLSKGFAHGDLYDFVFYQKEKIVSQTEVNNHYINKLSISAIPAGQIMIANHWATKEEIIRIEFTGIYRYDIGGTVAELASFTSTCFMSGTFTT